MPTFECLRLSQVFIGLAGPAFTSLAVSIFCLAAPAHAASFDCSKAKTSIEKQICADADVSRQDGLLQETYQKLLRESVEREKLKTEQREWIKARDRCLGKEPQAAICMSLTYYARRGSLETDLFLKGADDRLVGTRTARYPDMWLMRLEGDWYAEERKIFKLDRALQKKMGLRGRVDDYFSVDLLPSSMNGGFGKYLLRGFFSGEVVPVVPTDRKNSAFVSQSGVRIASDLAMAPLPVSKRTAEGMSVSLPDGTELRRKTHFLWHTGLNESGRPDLCERATRALERVDALNNIIWSRIILLDAGLRWSRTCGARGDPSIMSSKEYEEDRRIASFYWDEYVRLLIYPLDDGTFLAPSDAYLVRLRLSDGQFDRAGAGAAAIDTNKMMALKTAYKSMWPKRHKEAQRKYFNCIDGEYDPKEWDALTRKRCQKLYDDPFTSDEWKLGLNAEIRRAFLYPQAERQEVKQPVTPPPVP